MQQLSVAAVNRCVVRNGGTKAANQHVAGLRTGCADPVKSRRLQIIQIEIVTMPPPVVVPVKIRHINPRQMIGITEQRVTVKNPMFKLSSGQVWHTAEFMYLAGAYQPPRQVALNLQPAVHIAQIRLAARMAVNQRHNIPLRFSPQPVLRRHTEIILRRGRNIHAGEIPFSRLCSYHEAARLRRRTPSGVRQNVITIHIWLREIKKTAEAVLFLIN